MKRIVPFGLVSFAAALTACGSGGTGASSGALGQKAPTQLLASAITAAKKSGTVHFKLLGTASGKTETIIGDASATDGREIITIGNVNVQAEVVAGAAFVEGNAGGLETQMGLPATEAKTYAGKWISIASTDAPYASITQAVTLAATLAQLQPTGHLTLTAVTTRAAHSVIGVKGGLPGSAIKGTTGSAVLYVSTTDPKVPIVFEAEQTSGGTKMSDVGTFSDWGKPLHLSAPTSSVALSSLPVPSSTTPAG